MGSGSRMLLAPGEDPAIGLLSPPADVRVAGSPLQPSHSAAPTQGGTRAGEDRGARQVNPHPQGRLPHVHTLSSLRRLPKMSPPLFSPRH